MANHPYDTPLNSGLRFLSEILAWTACTWAAATISIWLAALVLVILVGLPTVFSTPGDKRNTIVATPGPIRVLLELALHVVAIVCFWYVWPTWAAAIGQSSSSQRSW